MRRFLTVAAVAAAFAVTSGASTPASAQESYKIGSILAMTGSGN